MLILDKRALVPLSLKESAFIPKKRIVPSRMGLVEKCDDEGNRFVRHASRAIRTRTLVSCQGPSNEYSNGFHERQSGYTAGHRLLWGYVELGDVTGAFLESAELRRQGSKLFLRQPHGGLPGLHPQQLLEIRLPL